jgi:hypothetical protein
MLGLEQGKKLIKLARKALENFFEKKKFEPIEVEDKLLKEKKRIFVTLEKFPDKTLRGSVGSPHVTLPLCGAVQELVLSSAFEDSRFLPLQKEELDKIILEISILTDPKLIEVKDSKEYFEKIEPGKDGLILQSDSSSSLFLPQVWKQIPRLEEFLCSLCLKANLPKDSWKNKNTKIWKFRIQAFKEISPNGNVVEVKL